MDLSTYAIVTGLALTFLAHGFGIIDLSNPFS